MSLTLEIVTPEKVVYHDTVDEAVLPTLEGEIGVLAGHIPLITLVSPGEIKVLQNNQWSFLAVDKGFARVFGNTVSILTEAAIQVADIDLTKVEEAHARAQAALEKAKGEKEIDPAEIEKLESIARFAVLQRLLKEKR